MSEEIVERVLRSRRYRDVDRSILGRLVADELPRSRNADDAVKRVKRRLHQAVGAFRGSGPARTDPLAAVRAAWTGDLADPSFRAACAAVLRAHASTAERIPYLDRFYAGIWARTGIPERLLDIGCGLGPLALPWMGIGAAHYVATDVDRRMLDAVDAFLGLVAQPHEARVVDAAVDPPADAADVALLLKLVTTLDRQDGEAAARLVRALRVRHAVVSFPIRSLGGRVTGMERTYRARLERLVSEVDRIRAVAEASVPNELVFVLSMDG
jgi:16S rRNA (guanine(1405)-N(7))-methyltransferase